MKLVLRESGAFYTAYNSDAKIMHKLFGYQIVKGRCGFPKGKLESVLSILKDKKIDTVVYNKEDDDVYLATYDNNQYDYYLTQAEKTILIDNRIQQILLKLKDEDSDRLDQLISLIGDFLDAKKGERVRTDNKN